VTVNLAVLHRGFSVNPCCILLLHTGVDMLHTEWRIMKNRKFVGTLLEQNVRAQSKPWIMEVDGLVGTVAVDCIITFCIV